jgi:hypothetical protein
VHVWRSVTAACQPFVSAVIQHGIGSSSQKNDAIMIVIYSKNRALVSRLFSLVRSNGERVCTVLRVRVERREPLKIVLLFVQE